MGQHQSKHPRLPTAAKDSKQGTGAFILKRNHQPKRAVLHSQDLKLRREDLREGEGIQRNRKLHKYKSEIENYTEIKLITTVI